MLMSSRNNKKKLSLLVHQIKAGDTDALATLYNTFAEEIFKYSMTIVPDVDLAEDVTSEVFLRMRESASSYRGSGAHIRAYLHTIAHNYIIDSLRKNRRIIRLCEHHEYRTAVNDTLDNALHQELDMLVSKALQALPKNYREVLTLRFMQQLSVKETALIMNKTEISIRVTQHRALRALENNWPEK